MSRDGTSPAPRGCGLHRGVCSRGTTFVGAPITACTGMRDDGADRAADIEELSQLFGPGRPANAVIAPISIGAVLMMRVPSCALPISTAPRSSSSTMTASGTHHLGRRSPRRRSWRRHGRQRGARHCRRVQGASPSRAPGGRRAPAGPRPLRAAARPRRAPGGDPRIGRRDVTIRHDSTDRVSFDARGAARHPARDRPRRFDRRAGAAARSVSPAADRPAGMAARRRPTHADAAAAGHLRLHRRERTGGRLFPSRTPPGRRASEEQRSTATSRAGRELLGP